MTDAVKLPELPFPPDHGFMTTYELGRVQDWASTYGMACYEAGVKAAASQQFAHVADAIADTPEDAIALRIQYAVRAERERCAQIAVNMMDKSGDLWDSACECIAAAIRESAGNGGERE